MEESCFMTRPEAEYCRMIASLAARAAAGSDAGQKSERLNLWLQAELEKPEGTMISLTDEGKNLTAMALMIYELLLRQKCDVLEEHFHVGQISMSAADIVNETDLIKKYVLYHDLDTGALQKKIRHRKKVPVRKLYIADLHFYHDSLNHRMDMRGFSGYEEMNAYMRNVSDRKS